MSPVKSLKDLRRIREEALEKQKVKAAMGRTQVSVGMGTCGIAVGAHETMKAILEVIQVKKLDDIAVTQTGCVGLCEREPIVQVVVGDASRVTYGKVTPEVATRILREHVLGGEVIREYVIEI